MPAADLENRGQPAPYQSWKIFVREFRAGTLAGFAENSCQPANFAIIENSGI
jgi:hypothetical protein